MAASGRYEDTEILYNHVETLISKMELVSAMLNPQSELARVLESGEGKNYMKYVNSYMGSISVNQPPPRPPTSTSTKQFLESIYPKVKLVAANIKYIFQWAQLTQIQLKLFIAKINELDIRWHQDLTIKICTLFSQLCKVALFCKFMPLMRVYSLIVQTSPETEFLNCRQDMNKCTQFLNQCYIDPFTLLKTHLQDIRGKLSRFTSLIGTYIAKLFGTFPLIEWEPFSIFTKRTSQPESTLPSDEFIILQNINLFKDTLFYFLFVFPETTKHNECFSLIIEAIVSECPYIYITRTLRLPLKDFLAIVPTDCFESTLLNSSVEQVDRKFSTSHMQRILRLTFLLNDIKNVCNYNPSLLPSLMTHITALGSLAAYEIDMYMCFDKRRTEAVELMMVLIEIANLVRKYQDTIQRFFTFNLASPDVQYLQRLLSPAVMQATASLRSLDMSQIIGDIIGALMGLDLEDFDKGTRYDFTALQISYGRYLAYFSELKTRERVSFLDHIFEHLTTVSFHCALAQNPVAVFLRYVPLHTTWRFTSAFLAHVRDPKVALGVLPAFLHIFTYFSYDTRVLRQLLSESSQVSKRFPEIRAAIFMRLTTALRERLSPNSPLVKIAGQSHTFIGGLSGFNPRDFAAHRGISKELAMSQTQAIQAAADLKVVFDNLPQSVLVLDKNEDTGGYFARNITDNLAKYLFPDDIPDAVSMDMSFAAASQFVWPLFASLGNSFPRRLFECRLLESSNPTSISLKQQTDELAGMKKKEDPANMMVNTQRLVFKISAKVADFLNNGPKSALYIPPLKGFWAKEGLKYDCSTFFSRRAFEYFIENLGIHCGIEMDVVCLRKIADEMISIFALFIGLIPKLTEWKKAFDTCGSLPAEVSTNPKLAEAVDRMISLGFALQLRAILRDSMAKTTEVSIPGIRAILGAALSRNKSPTPSEELLREVFMGDTNDMVFVRFRVQNAVPEHSNEFALFHFFAAAMLASDNITRMEYSAKNDAITDNLHLFPRALAAILLNADMLFEGASGKTDLPSFRIFLNVLAQIVAWRRPSFPEFADALTILADKLPASVEGLEYGRLEDFFPNRAVSLAYSASIQQNK